MKAARLVGPKLFELLEAEAPTAQDGECLVRLERVSVCGSDIRHGFAINPEEYYPAPIGHPCHELAGTIVDSRTDAYHEGQRVIVIPPRGSAGLVEYIVSDPGRMILLPDEGSLDEWVMCQPSGTVLYSCQQMPNLLGKNVVVMGQGSIGLSFTMITSRIGARNVIAVDLLDYRLEASKTFGSTHQLNPDRENLEEAVAEITGGVGADVVVEAAGYADTFNMCFRSSPPEWHLYHIRHPGRGIHSAGAQLADGQAAPHHSHDGRPQRGPHQSYPGDRCLAPAGLVRSLAVGDPPDGLLGCAEGIRYV